MKDRLKNIDKRKFFGTIVGIILFSSLALYFTYARYEWRSADTNVTINFEDVMLEFTNGGNVNVSNIGPVLNYTDGVKATFTATSIAGEVFPFVVKLDITSISETLLVESFKYKLMRDTSGGTNYTEEVASGDFSFFGVGENVIYVETMAPTSVYSYQFIVYIDGNMPNDNNMQQNSLVSTLLVTDDDAIIDYSGNNNYGVNMGATWNMEEGIITTDGVDDYIDCGLKKYYFADTISMAMRVKFSSSMTEARTYNIFGNQESNGGGFFWGGVSKTLFFEYFPVNSSGYVNVHKAFEPSLTDWYTIVGVWNQGVMSLFINGEKVATDTKSYNLLYSSPAPFYLGANPQTDGTKTTFETPITFDSVLIFDRALTDSEIAANYTGIINPVDKTELLLYYTFDF